MCWHARVLKKRGVLTPRRIMKRNVHAPESWPVLSTTRRPPPSFLTTPNLPSVGLRDLFGPSFGPAPSELNDLVQQFPELGIRFRFLPELAVGSSELEPQVRYSV